MSIGALLPSAMLATMPLGSDNNDYVGDSFVAPDTSTSNGGAVPGIGTNPNDPTQVGDTGSGVAADTTSGFDINSFLGTAINAAMTGYLLSQAKPGVATVTVGGRTTSVGGIPVAATAPVMNSFLTLALIAGVVLVVIFALKGGS